MENSRKKPAKPKTIRIKYPAQYSAKADPDSVLSPKPSKRKPRIASYSAQTWLDKEKRTARQSGKQKPARRASSRQIALPTHNRKKNSTRPRGPRRLSPPPPSPSRVRPNFCRAPIRRPDPSAPHLKYGLFPSRNPSVLGNVSSAAAVFPKPGFKKKANPTDPVILGRSSVIKGNSMIMRRKTSPKLQESREYSESEPHGSIGTRSFEAFMSPKPT